MCAAIPAMSVPHFNFPRVETSSDLQAQRLQGVTKGDGTANGATRAVEGREYPVTSRLDNFPAVLFDDRARYRIVGVQ